MLLRGAGYVDAALTTALRFLSHHYQAAIAYAVGPAQLELYMAAGDIADLPRLREVRPVVRGLSTLVALMNCGEASTYLATCPADYRLAKLATGRSEVAALAIPLLVGGDPRFVLWAASPRGETQPTGAELDRLRAELERALVRVDPRPLLNLAMDG